MMKETNAHKKRRSGASRAREHFCKMSSGEGPFQRQLHAADTPARPRNQNLQPFIWVIRIWLDSAHIRIWVIRIRSFCLYLCVTLSESSSAKR